MTITATSTTLSNIPTAQLGGKKKNGHKPNYGCPICANMRHSKKKGGADEEDQQGDIEEGFAPTETSEVESAIDAATNYQEAESSSEDNDLNSAELGEAGPGTKTGGTRRRKKRSSRKTKKTRKTRKLSKRRSHRRH